MSLGNTPKSAPLFLKLVTPTRQRKKDARLAPAHKSTFILSTGRTGTKFLADLLSQLDDVIALHEPKPSRILQAWSSAYAEGRVSDEYMRRVLVAKRKRLFRDMDASLYVESNHFIDGFVEHINELVQNPMIVHVVRDPRDFITSMINRGNDTGWKLLVNKYVPYWAYTAPGYKRTTMTPIEREACHWLGMNRLLSEYGKLHDNYHLFAFEDLFRSEKSLQDVFRTIGLDDDQINQLDTSRAEKNPSRITGKKAMPSWHDWSDQECQTVQKICGPLMKEYGYGEEGEWQRRVQGSKNKL